MLRLRELVLHESRDSLITNASGKSTSMRICMCCATLYVLIACAGAMQSGAANWGGGSGSARGDGRWCERWCAIEEVKRATARASEERSRLHVSASVSGHSRSLAFRPNDL